MDEIDKHYLKFDRPYIYTCSCGVVAFMDRRVGFSIDEMPDKKIVYLERGHAVCARTEQFDCIICVMTLQV